MKKIKKGFTLIELLVVVLIIGILAAVALPQYQVAVQKTRSMSLLPLLRAIDTAEQIYFLENGTYTLSFEDLSIDMPAGGSLSVNASTGTNRLRYDNFACLLRTSESGTSAYCNDTSRADAPQLEKYFDRNYYICWETNPFAKKICQNISGKTTQDFSTGSGGGIGYTF